MSTLAVSALASPSAYAADEAPAKVKRAKVDEAKLSVAYPADWVRLELTEDDLDSLREASGEENPEVSAGIDSLDASSIKLHAQDPVDGDSVMVQVIKGAIIGGKKFVRAQLEAQLEGAPGFEVVRMRDVKVGNKRGVRADYRYELVGLQDEPLPVYEVQVFVPIGHGKIAVVDVATDDEPADVANADEIVRSVRLLQ